VRLAVIAVDSDPARGYPTANGSCLHWVASIPANLYFMQKFLSASRLPGVCRRAPCYLPHSIRPGNPRRKSRGKRAFWRL